MPRGLIAGARAPFLAGLRTPPEASPALRALAVALIAVIYFAISAAHQLTPYLGLAGATALAVLGPLRRGWLVPLVLGVIAGGYLAPRYGLISHQFGGLFSGGNPIGNASGVSGITPRPGAGDDGADRARAGRVHVAVALAAIVRQRRALGRVVIPPPWPSARSSSSARRVTAARRSTVSSCSPHPGARC